MKTNFIFRFLAIGMLAVTGFLSSPVAGLAASENPAAHRMKAPEDHGTGGGHVRHAGNSSLYIVDIAATDSHGPARLMVNLDRQRFVFHGRGFRPGTEYALHYGVEGGVGLRVFATGVASRSGNLRVSGSWSGDLSTLRDATFATSTMVVILPNMPVIAVYNDYCLGPYYRVGAFFVTSPVGGLVVGTTVDLMPTGDFDLYCVRYVQRVIVMDANGVSHEAYMFPAS